MTSANETQVHLLLTGMVSMLPQQRGITVVLKNLQAACHPHRAHIVAAEDVMTLPAGVESKTENKRKAVWLNRCTVEIVNCTTTPLRLNDSNIIVKTDKAGHAAKLDTNLPSGPTAAAILDISAGTVASTWEHPEVVWALNGGTPKSLSEQVCVQFSVFDAALILRVHERGQVCPYHIFVRPSSTGRIEVQLGNLPEQDVFRATERPEPGDTDHHFHMYCQMAKPAHSACDLTAHSRTGGTGDLPQNSHHHDLTLEYRDDRGRSTGGHNCPPTLWTGVGLASADLDERSE